MDEIAEESIDECSTEEESSEDDEDVSILFGFDEESARHRLKSFANVTQITLSPSLQKEICVIPGKQITEQHPWKGIKKEVLEKHLDSSMSLEAQTILDALQEVEPDCAVLVEFAPELTTEQNAVYRVFTDAEEINEASEIIRCLELLDRLRMRMMTEKLGRDSSSEESEEEDDDEEECDSKDQYEYDDDDDNSKNKENDNNDNNGDNEDETDARDSEDESDTEDDTDESDSDDGSDGSDDDSVTSASEEAPHELEAQFVYAVPTTSQALSLRKVTDARDGFVELLPGKWKNTNIPRKTTDRGTQVRQPSCSQGVQADPTFPLYASTQYDLDLESKRIDPGTISPTWLQTAENLLSSAVRHNLIEPYRYEYDAIARQPVQCYRTPLITERLSFMDRSRTIGRYVRSIDWHPELSGIFVASYTFETTSQDASDVASRSTRCRQFANRMMFEKFPLLMWSFTDPLTPLLELQTIREVTTVSFCPYDGELLVAGLANGQIVLWDMKGVIERVESDRPEWGEHHAEILLQIEQPADEAVDRTVSPTAFSALEHSPRGAITVIKWLPRNHFCTTTGHLKVNPEKEYRFIVTASLDGSICFWDFDFTSPALQKKIASVKGGVQLMDKPLYQRVNNLFFPVYKILCQCSIVSMVIDEALYDTFPIEPTWELTKRVKHVPEPVSVECSMQVTLGTFMGTIVEGLWEGYAFEQAVTVNDESMQVTHSFCAIHDGQVVALERNQLMPRVFLSIGGHVLAMWSYEDRSSPIFWRKRSSKVTACRWSLDRVSVFFVGYDDGNFEVWDLNMKTFHECVRLNLGAAALTAITQHRLASARCCLAVADHNANVRILAISDGLIKPAPFEEQTFRDIIQRELARKAGQAQWIKGYNDANQIQLQFDQDQAESRVKDIADHRDGTSLEKDIKSKKKLQIKEGPPHEQDMRLSLSDRLEKQYRARHFRELLGKLMQRRNVSPTQMARDMRPVTERRRYDAEKKAAIERGFSEAGGDYVNLKKTLRPTDKSATSSKSRGSIGHLQSLLADFAKVEQEAKEKLQLHYLPQMENFTEVLMRVKDRREKVAIQVGDNMRHLVRYENKRSQRRLGMAPRTQLMDLMTIEEPQRNDDEEEIADEESTVGDI
ncbi:WD repeat-containing protein 63-like [Anopheles albimanus]|uniref:WD repeat-containing protein 63 n=1 Tax=Anopheles albimanus TaxID=7167 RepID=A0A182F420_ANOAL|nr:WD repeat-containing protein 63-like [Anopheles albimanus]